MSKFFSYSKELIKKTDLFASVQFLRFQKDAETKTLTGGIITLAIIIFLTSQFATMFLDALGKVNIISVTNTIQAAEPPSIQYSTHDNGKKFMLGIQLWGYDLVNGPRYFDISAINAVLIQGRQSNESVNIPLQPCTKEHWAGLPDIDALYGRVGMSTWLCLPVNQTYTVSGNYISEIQRSIDINVSKCSNASNPSRPCATPQQIQTFMRSDSQFYWTPYFMNPLISPQNEQFLTYYLEDKWYVMTGYNSGSEMYVYSDDFQITTDESILPFSSEHTQTGAILDQVFSSSYQLDNTTDRYLLINFFRSPNSRIIKREFQKILDVFSYVGGLLGAFLLFFILTIFYNEESYEMNFATALYLPEKGSPTSFQKFNILYFIQQGVYTVFRFFGCKLDWKNTQFFYNTRQEMLKQLDVMFLFRKIHFLEGAMNLLLTRPQLKGLMLQHELNVTEAKEIRTSYCIKRQIAKIAKQKIKERKTEENQDELRNSQSLKKMDSLRISDGERGFGSKKDLLSHQKQGSPNLQLQKEKELQINMSEYGSDSEEEGTQQNYRQKEEELIQDLHQLQEDCYENNEISMKIYNNMDPKIRKYLEKITNINLERIQQKPKKQLVFEFSKKRTKNYEADSPEKLMKKQEIPEKRVFKEKKVSQSVLKRRQKMYEEEELDDNIDDEVRSSMP